MVAEAAACRIFKKAAIRLFECFYKMSKMKVDDVDGVLPDIEESLIQGVGRYNEDKKTFCNDLLVYMKTIKSFYKNMLDADVQKICAGIEKISEKNSHLVGYLKVCIATIYLHRGDLISADKHIKKR